MSGPPRKTTSRVTNGRGAAITPAPRYLAETRDDFDDGWGNGDEEPAKLITTVQAEQARSVISRNQSPDLPFDQSLNPYRGCEHGCVYCYARPSHAYLDLSPGLDFESRLFAKENVVEVLRKELTKPGYRCTPLAIGTNTDCYQPIERARGLTRGVLEIMLETRHPLTIVTKSALIERDIDLLGQLAAHNLVEVFISITTLDHTLARRLEPRATAPSRRLTALGRIAAAGIPCGVMLAPVIAGLNDHEIESILTTAASVGAAAAGYVVLRLPREVSPMFQAWLHAHYPLKADKIMSLMRAQRGGKDYDSDFADRMKGRGEFAQLTAQRFNRACRQLGLNVSRRALDCAAFTPPSAQGPQLSLF